ncbi:MAG: VCBS repeat-containing protein [Planctomycetes bacterium]|nr:VCBS repeat-containing protein [Planctomycetota bacterium]
MAVKLADFDGDGDLDLILGGYGLVQFPPRLYLNDGNGTFRDATSTHLPAINAYTRDIAVGDLDGDGHPDIALANQAIGLGMAPLKLLLNDGSGRFRDETSQRITPAFSTGHVLLIDVDQDGSPDLLWEDTGTLFLFINEGKGSFRLDTSKLPPLRPANITGLAAGDLDGDGDQDIVVGGTWGPRLLINDGIGRFTYESATRLPPLTRNYFMPELGDVDRDGDLDLLMTDYYGLLELFLNDGKGRFAHVTSTHLPATNRWAWRVYLRDLDGDGDCDILNATTIGAWGLFDGEEQVLENDGSGRFTDATSRFIADLWDGGTPMAAVGDVDGDGDLDVVLPDAGGAQHPLGRQRLYLNLTRHLHAYGAAALGQPYILTIYGSPGAIALPLIASSAQRTPIPPFGTFGLAPDAHVALAAVTLDASRQGTAMLKIPQDPALLNQTIYSQVLLIDPNQLLASRFTNVMADRIR